MRALAEFQAQFAAALHDPHTPLLQSLGAGFAVYQNTVSRGLIEALRANYPVVEQLVGAEWFDSVARLYALEHLPGEPSLAIYGAGFAAFLQPYSDAHELDYLPAVAELDRLWLEAYFAIDASALQAMDLQHYAPEQLSALPLRLHPAVRFAWLPHSAPTIWQHHRVQTHSATRQIETPLVDVIQVADQDEGVLISRAQGQVHINRIDRAQWLFLQQLEQGLTLGDVALQVLAQHPDADIAATLAKLINAGALLPTRNNDND